MKNPIKQFFGKRKLTNVAASFGLLTKKDKLTFGKYSGLLVKTVLAKDPGYICWVHDNTSHKFTRELIIDAREKSAHQQLNKAATKYTTSPIDYDYDDLAVLGLGMEDCFH